MIKEILKKNKPLAVLFIIQLLFLTVLFMKIWTKPLELHLEPTDFTIIENLGVHILDDGGIGTVIDDENQHEGYDILTFPLEGVGSGEYEVSVNYKSIHSMANPSHSVTSTAGSLSFSSQENGLKLESSQIILDDGHDIANGRIWMHISSHINDLTGTVHFNGNGQLEIYSVDIVENPAWRVVRVFQYLALFLLLDLFYILFFSEGMVYLHNKTTGVCLFGIIIAASLPLFADFLFKVDGHDLEFHLTRIWWIADGLKNGQFPVRMDTGMLNGAGYAGSLFYGEIFLYFPAILYNMMVPLQTCYNIYAFTVNLATCLVSYYCFKKISGSREMGLLASCLYTLSAYRLTNLYIRAAVGEYTAMLFLPLVVLGFYGVYEAEDNRKIKLSEYIPIVIGLTGLIQSHILTCEMTALFIFFFCVIYVKKTVQKYRFIALCKAAVLTVLVNLWFLGPFLESMQMNVNVAKTTEINQIQKFGTYLIQLFGIFYTGTGGVGGGGGIKGEMPQTIGLPFTIIIGLFLYCCINRQEWKLSSDVMYKKALGIFAGAVAAIYMTTIYFPWDSIKYFNQKIAYFLCSVQFPMRYLTIATIALTLLTMFTVQLLKDKKGKRFVEIIVIILVASNLMTTGFFYLDFTNNATGKKVFTINELGTMDIMGEEYLLDGSDTYMVSVRAAETSSGMVKALKWTTQKGKTELRAINHVEESGWITLPIFHYDNYHAIDTQTGEELTIQSSNNNTIQIKIPGNYFGNIEISYIEPNRWRVYEVISLLTILGLIGTVCYKIRKGHTKFRCVSNEDALK